VNASPQASQTMWLVMVAMSCLMLT
jgi:hypothetical protein